MLRRIRGQSTAEYAIVIGLVIAAAVAMQIYVKRSLQAKIKDATDYNDADAVAGGQIGTTSQYEPYYNTQDVTSTRAGSTLSETTNGGGVVRTIQGAGDVSTRTGSTTVEAAPVVP